MGFLMCEAWGNIQKSASNLDPFVTNGLHLRKGPFESGELSIPTAYSLLFVKDHARVEPAPLTVAQNSK